MRSNREIAESWVEACKGGYTTEELKAAMDLVQNKEHWKGPIDCLVSGDADLTCIFHAVAFYTGAGPEFTDQPDGLVRVTAPGYWATIGA